MCKKTDTIFKQLAQKVDEAMIEVEKMEDEAYTTAMNLKEALEELHKHSWVRLIHLLNQNRLGQELLLELIDDPDIHTLFLRYGLRNSSLEQRIGKIVATISSRLQRDMELIRVEQETAYIRLFGESTPSTKSEITQMLKTHLPELEQVNFVEVQKSDFQVSETTALEKRKSPDTNGWFSGPTVAELKKQGSKLYRIQYKRYDILIVHQKDQFYAYKNACTHRGYPLDNSLVEGETLICPRHAVQYDVGNGQCLTAAHAPLESYPVRVEAERLWIKIEEE